MRKPDDTLDYDGGSSIQDLEATIKTKTGLWNFIMVVGIDCVSLLHKKCVERLILCSILSFFKLLAYLYMRHPSIKWQKSDVKSKKKLVQKEIEDRSHAAFHIGYAIYSLIKRRKVVCARDSMQRNKHAFMH